MLNHTKIINNYEKIPKIIILSIIIYLNYEYSL